MGHGLCVGLHRGRLGGDRTSGPDGFLLVLVGLLQVLKKIIHQWIQILLLLRRLLSRVYIRARLLRLCLTVETATREFFRIFFLIMRQVWHDGLVLLVATGGASRVLYAGQLGARRSKWALCAALSNTVALLGLDRTEVIAPSCAMIHKVALSECFLEILTRLALETSRVLGRCLNTCARTLVVARLALFGAVLVAEHQIVSVKFTTLSRFHQFVCFVGSSGCGRVLISLALSAHVKHWIELLLVVTEGCLALGRGLLLPEEELFKFGATLGRKAREGLLRFARARLEVLLDIRAWIGQFLCCLVLHGKLLHMMEAIKAAIGTRVMVARLLNLLSDYRLSRIALHASIHKIQLLDMHGIFTQLGQIAMPYAASTYIASIYLDTRRCSSVTAALVHVQVRVLAVPVQQRWIGSALCLGAESLLTRLETLRCSRIATLLSFRALKRRTFTVAVIDFIERIAIVGGVANVACDIFSSNPAACLTSTHDSSSLRSHQF